MSQTDSYQVPAHPSGIEMRTQLNVIVLALLGDNCGPTEPVEMYPGMMWGDTTAMRLRRRTNANDAWINIGPLDNFLGDIQSQIDTSVAGKVSKTGDTMTGYLSLPGAYVSNGGYNPRLASDPAIGIGFINGAGNNWIFTVDDAGNAKCTAAFTVGWGTAIVNGRLLARYGPGTGAGGGEIGIQSPEGFHFFIRGKAGAGVEFVNDAYNSVLGYIDNGGSVQFNGNLNMGGEVWAGYGNGRLITNGDIYGTVWNGWLSSWLSANKANNGAQCQWNSGIAELASAMGGNPVVDASAPWVMEGVRVTVSTDINRIYPRVIWLRNQ